MSYPRALRRPLLAVAAGVTATLFAAPAHANPGPEPDPGAAGAPITALQAQSLNSVACVAGGPTSADTDIANAIRSAMNGVRMGANVNGYNISCARAITAKVRATGLNQRAAVIAVTTAITETTLHNYDGGADDSVGLFQQRPSQGWGSVADLLKPAYATHAFLDAMIRINMHDSWQQGDIGAICQSVQRSAVPGAYAKEAHDAGLIVDRLWTQDSAVLPRIGVVTAGDVAFVKQGSLSAEWINEHAGIRQVVVDGDRIGVLTGDGIAKVKDGSLSAEWITEYSGAQQIALAGNRIGVLSTAGVALVKDGGLSADWVTEHPGVKQIALAGDRIGVLTGDGIAKVKDGSLSAEWITEYSGAQQIALAGNRIGVLSTAGAALVKDGGLSADWTNQYTGIKQIAVAGDRIGVLTADGTAFVKDGGLSAGWVNQYSGVQQLALAADRIGVLTTDGTALVKDGGLSAKWVTEYPGVKQIALS